MTHEELLSVINDVHSQHADDLCWMDIDKIFSAAGLTMQPRSVGDKAAMRKNCDRYIDIMCSGGTWKSYAELEEEITRLTRALHAAKAHPDYCYLVSPGGCAYDNDWNLLSAIGFERNCEADMGCDQCWRRKVVNRS